MASELIVVCYPSADVADRVVVAARRLQSAQLLHVEAAVSVRRDEDGNITTRQVLPRRGQGGVVRGLVLGTLLGKFFGVPLVGGSLGALASAVVRRLGDASIDADFVEEFTHKLGPNTSELFALVRRTGGPDRLLAAPEKVMPELAEFGGTILHTTLPTEMDDRIQAALDEAHRHFLTLKAEAAAASRKHRVVPIASARR
jgi:uncharacterized membrane protein